MRLVVAKRNGRRGAGLGNEILPWAKGWIASQELAAHLVGPSWGINQRRYFRNFRTSRLDFLFEDGLQHLPHYTFTEQDYRSSGQVDFGQAVKRWAHSRALTNKRSFIVCVEGMWGGYSALHSARSFLLGELLHSRDALRNVYQIAGPRDRNKLFVAVHMRSDAHGFVAPEPGTSVRGMFNILVPGDWYLWVCSQLMQRYGNNIQFHIFTDRGGPEFDEVVCRFNPGQAVQTGLTECSDLLLMAQADLRICSVSSYSLAANFLSGGPFVWYEPQLTLSNGQYTLWGDTETRGPARSRAAACFDGDPSGAQRHGMPAAVLGIAMKIGDRLPENLTALLDKKLSCLDSRTNLLEYGALPESWS